ncbi:hypothetical protein TWF730_009093 [Orbilia blumenaviensis]|uniref:Uncharacterized protein n=1 Tax=Orbilia blumenaviensis TaxID=1796055 RepID=A0AAV9V024_9PEZI
MPSSDGRISSTIKSLLCCSILRRTQSTLSIHSEEETTNENEEVLIDAPVANLSLSGPETSKDNDITPVHTNRPIAPTKYPTQSPIAIALPLFPDSPETPSPLIQPPAMFSPATMFRLSLCHEDIYSLRHLLSQSPSMGTYRAVLPQIYEILRREEIRYLFNTEDDGDYVIVGEKVRFCEEILEVAYWDADAGGDRRLAGWVERGLGGVVECE